MTDEAYDKVRTDWRSLFVHDPETGVTSLVRGATLEDVERRLKNWLIATDQVGPKVVGDGRPSCAE